MSNKKAPSWLVKSNNFMKSSKMSIIDWSIAICCVLWGTYELMVLKPEDTMFASVMIGGGLLGCLLAYIKPVKYIGGAVGAKAIKKN